MINSLHIANFQSHKESQLDFAPGLNVILGQSDSGKTAILRALYWIYANRPSGEGFRSWFAGNKETMAILDTDDFHITRQRGKENRYVMAPAGQAIASEFKALGKAVPEEVVKALNMTDINWQMQFQSIFLLSDSPGEVARKLNEIVKLDVIDWTLSNLNSGIRQNNQAVQTEEKTVAEQVEELAGYEYLEKMEDDVAKVEGWEQKWIGLSEEYEEIEGLLLKIDGLETELTDASQVLVLEDQVDALSKLDRERLGLKAERQLVGYFITQIGEREEEILLAGEHLDDLQQEFKRLMPDVCPFYDEPCPLHKEMK